MATTDPRFAGWRTSSYSNVGGECVEVAAAGGMVGVRDSKDRAGGTLALSPEGWRRFTAWAKSTVKG